MMSYKIIYQKERYIVVNKDSYGAEVKVTPNLTDQEIRIEYLKAKKCPLDVFCVHVVHGNVSSICVHMGLYPSAGKNGQYDFNRIICAKDGKDHELEFLKAEQRNRPVLIEEAGNIHIPDKNRLEKSNACVVLK